MIVDTLVNVFADATEVATSHSEGEDKSRLLGVRILLAEDNDINQQIAVELLEGVGASVKVANNGRLAVERLLYEPTAYDLVLMDIQMPEMDGYQATAKIRSESRFASLPIIAMTAHATIEEKQRCLAAGMNDHVSKPIDPDALFATLMRWTKPQAKPSAESEVSPIPSKTVDEVILPEVVGVNLADGLNRVAGNKRLYRDLLGQFAKKQGDAAVHISAALENGDPKLAERIAHTVKGVAGNIGIAEVQSAAEKLERSIREGGDSVAMLLDTFATLLGNQVHAIEEALQLSAPAQPDEVLSSPFNGEVASAAIARLRILLNADDGDAGEAFRSLQGVVAGAVDRLRLDDLSASISDFDFEAALLKLDGIAELCCATKTRQE